MKKVMFGLAAAAAIVAFGDGIESANIVGYTTSNPAAGKKSMLGIPFVNVSGGAFDIQSIQCKDGTSNPPGGYFRIWWWDQTAGYQYASYKDDVYADDGEDDGDGTEYTDGLYWADDDDWILVPAGWKHDANATATINDHSKTFAAGEGFFVQPDSSVGNAKVAFANPFYVAQ